MSGRCALRLRQCIHFARKRGVLSWRSAAGSGPLVARHRQVHAPCETETGNGHKRRSPKQTHPYGVLGYKGARRKRLDQRNAPLNRFSGWAAASALAITTSIRTLWNNLSRWKTQRIPKEYLVLTQRHSERHSCSLFSG